MLSGEPSAVAVTVKGTIRMSKDSGQVLDPHPRPLNCWKHPVARSQKTRQAREMAPKRLGMAKSSHLRPRRMKRSDSDKKLRTSVKVVLKGGAEMTQIPLMRLL